MQYKKITDNLLIIICFCAIVSLLRINYEVINLNLYVVRHGKTIVNTLRLMNARNNIGLNRTGKKQALSAEKQMENTKIDLIICSPLKRTRQTCKIINKNNIKVIYDERLLERDARKYRV